jgi:hypothetical protein
MLQQLLDVEPNLQNITPVIGVVGRFGPMASEALPRLRELSESGDPAIRTQAQTAVTAIEGSGR